MSCMAKAMFVVLSAVAPLRAPDLQVEAATASGAALPELADAVARALVAGGARVVLRGPGSGACEYCAQVTVTEVRPGSFLVEANQDRHAASATLRLPAGSSLFDRARAIAIQARLLVTWRRGGDVKAKEVASRPTLRKPEPKTAAEPPGPSPEVATLALPPIPAWDRSLPPIPMPEPVPEPPPPPAVQPSPDFAAPAPAEYAERAERTPATRVEKQPARRAERRASESRRPESTSTAGVDVARARPASQKPQWPWIPTVVGAGAAVGAGICAWTARNRYDALGDKTRDYESAKALKSAGERWQWASIVLSGAAVVGLTTGIVGFATRSSGSSSVTALASPLPGGGMLAVAGDWP